MMYKHWKKIVLAVTAFFWNACDNSSTPTAPPVGPDSSSGTNLEPVSSATTNPSSSAVSPSSSAANPASSSVASPKSSSSVNAKSSSSSVTEKVSSSSLDQNADLYGCPPDVCGPEPSSSSVRSSSSAPIVKSSSSGVEVVPLYGVLMETCTKTEGDSTLACSGGVTCVESVTEKSQIPSCSGDQICAKYGVVIIRDKTYKCSDGMVYNEAEFQARYNVITTVNKPEKKIPCYKDRGVDYVDCDDGMSFGIDTDERGNKVYENEYARLSEKDFLNNYEIFEQQPALYGPPCMFNGTCDEEK
ncbi:MAG: hypothetical protein IKS96_10405 [Fibrobacter sp.]|nr:hypothetical protein [Fibrobacter sp.]